MFLCSLRRVCLDGTSKINIVVIFYAILSFYVFLGFFNGGLNSMLVTPNLVETMFYVYLAKIFFRTRFVFNWFMVGENLFDIAKFILSVMVVAIHTSFYPEYLYPWLRLAVPLFFVISGYLFFTKSGGGKLNLYKFVNRVIVLYIFWTIALLPLIFLYRKWYVLNWNTFVRIFSEFMG